MTADKVPGIRATLFRLFSLQSLSREHNNANVIGLSVDSLILPVNEAIVDTSLSTEFAGGQSYGRREDHA